MDAQTIYINASTGEVHATNTGKPIEFLKGILGTELNVAIAFHTDGSITELAALTTGRLVVKARGNQSGDPLLLDEAWAESGAGIARRYSFAPLCDSVDVRALLEGKDSVMAILQVEWQLAAEEYPRRSLAIPLLIVNSAARDDDAAPDVAADAAWAWIKARLTEGDNITFTVDEEAKTITIAAATPAHAGTHAEGGADPITLTQAQVTGLAAALAAKAPLASPALTGTPTAPTAAGGTNTTQLATTAFVRAELAALVASSPASLDTLNELAAALGNDANFSATVTAALAAKAPLASPALSGVPTAPTAVGGTNTTQVATTAFVQAAIAGLGGGGPMIDSDVAYLDAAGDDDTGDGTPGSPWRTAQKAYDEGYRNIRAGVGAFGDITGTDLALMLIGCGSEQTSFGAIFGRSGSVHGNGRTNVYVASITIRAQDGATGTNGGTSVQGGAGGDGADAELATIYGLYCAGDILLAAGKGGNGGEGGPGDSNENYPADGGPGGNGGAGAELRIRDVYCSGNVSSQAGAGGDGGNGGTDGILGNANAGNGGNGSPTGGTVTVHSSIIVGLVTAPLGAGGSGGAGGSNGNDGGNGAVTVTLSDVGGVVEDGTTNAVNGSMSGGAFFG